jgi:hypothetical protein
MPLQLVRDAIEQSRARDPLTCAVILVTGSRVLAYMDLPAAKAAFLEGVAALGNEYPLRADAVVLGVPAAPEAAIELYRQLPPDGHLPPIVNILVRHGELALALALFEDFQYPVDGADALIQADPNPEFQLRVLRAAWARWRLPRPRSWSVVDRFYSLFARHFHLLPAEEATAWLEPILARITATGNQRIDAQCNDVRLSTVVELHLFELLNVLRACLPPAAVHTLLDQHPSLAAAAKVYPQGLYGIVPQPRPTTPIDSPPNRYTAIPHLLAEAQHLYLEDITNNEAPRILWPASKAYNLALHEAGKQHGMAGAKHLAEIPDTGLALRATIEFVAGVLGLPFHSGIWRLHPNQ